MATTELVKGSRAARSTIALKLLMAVSGLLFIGFTVGHMYGNLKAFSGEEAFNEYAHHLRELGTPMLPYEGFLWIVRVGLLAAIIVHIACAVALWHRAAKARPVQYVAKKNRGSSLSSRTMRWGGITLLLFIVWHLLNFTIVKVNPSNGSTGDDNPYQLVVDTFDTPWMTVIYLLAMVALGFHLHHGTFSSLQTLGFTNTASSRARARAAGWIVAIVIAGGFTLVPLSVLVGIIEK
ncbi:MULTISPECIES: succinate dehydrogenase cytochrome b subunit [unclassified Nocardioides]|uniref:succinate dehydrogenase cytochrome b subunit n=1 Tax=unclassified Nocardioides TaxID=2615069 RepID=UPI0006FEA132|nr:MULTISPECIES: succinate dehydrogenase cytochrome b subunit [unclassified Nocardioides]KRA38293.1 succinate dehydrogenase [Nocardioides sp. Root614]KRA92252.1 succinate dehydrogenase [Nocardioides sp. Root682]